MRRKIQKQENRVEVVDEQKNYQINHSYYPEFDKRA